MALAFPKPRPRFYEKRESAKQQLWYVDQASVIRHRVCSDPEAYEPTRAGK